MVEKQKIGTSIISHSIIHFAVIGIISAATVQAATPNTSISSQQWQISEGAVIENDVLRINGDPAGIRSAYCVLPQKTLEDKKCIFIARIRISNISSSDPLPRLCIEDNSGELFSAEPSLFAVPDPGKWKTIAFLCRFNQVEVQGNLIIKVVLEKTDSILELHKPHFAFNPPGLEGPIDPQNIFPFFLPPPRDNILSIRFNEKKNLPHELLGVNKIFMDTGTKPIDKDPGLPAIITASDPRVQELVHRVAPLSIRFPGGTMGNWYNWQTDNCSIPDWDQLDSRYQKSYRFLYQDRFKWDFEGYAALCRQYEITPVLMLNILYDSPDQCAAQLRHRISQGIRPVWVELGNENFMEMQRGAGNVRTIQDYIRITREIMNAIKEVDPNVRCAVNIPGSSDRAIPPDSWSAELIKEDFYDGVIIHPYLHVPVLYLQDQEAIKKLFGAYGFMREYLDNCCRYFKGKKILISEWGVSMHGVTGLNSFLQELGDAEQFMAILHFWQQGIAAQSSIHQLLGGRMGLYDFDPSKGYRHFMKRRKGVLFELLWNTFRDSSLFSARPVTELLHDQNPVYDGIPSLNAVAAQCTDGRIRVFCVNKMPRTEYLWVRIDGRDYLDHCEHLIFKEELHVDRLYELNEFPCRVERGAGRIALPSCSINVITLEKNK